MDADIREIRSDASVTVGLGRKIAEFVRFRELLLNLVRKELKVRYKNSALGFFWSMVNPLLYLVVFYIVFNLFLRGGIPKFHVYLLAGLLPWNFFSTSLGQSTGAIVGNADLVKKVYFPREMLPLSSVGAALVHFVLQFAVLVGFLLITRYPFTGRAMLLIPAALGAEVLFVVGVGLAFSAVNVKARDVQHLLELLLLAWFWMTPIVYPSGMVAQKMADRSLAGLSMLGVYLANPMTRVALAFQRGIYGSGTATSAGEPVLIDASLGWYFKGIGYVALAGVAAIMVGMWIFYRLEGQFAEEL